MLMLPPVPPVSEVVQPACQLEEKALNGAGLSGFVAGSRVASLGVVFQ